MRCRPVYPLIKNIPIKELKSKGWNFAVVSIATPLGIIVLHPFFYTTSRSTLFVRNHDVIDSLEIVPVVVDATNKALSETRTCHIETHLTGFRAVFFFFLPHTETIEVLIVATRDSKSIALLPYLSRPCAREFNPSIFY